MGVGQELTNGFKRVGHVFSFMLKQKKIPPRPHINNDRFLKSRHSATKDKFFHVKNVFLSDSCGQDHADYIP